MDSIDIDKISASDADPKVVEVYRELKRFKESPARAAWVKRDKEAYNSAIKNKMWTDDEEAQMKKTGEIPVVKNYLNKGVQGKSAIVTANNPEIKVFPTRQNDPYLAELLKWGIDFVWAKNSGNDVIEELEDRHNIGGHSFLYVKEDGSKGMFGRIVLEYNDPLDWYWSDQAKKRDFSDTHLIKAQLRSKKYIKDHYDSIKDEDLEFQTRLDAGVKPDDMVDTKTGEDNYTHGIGEDPPPHEGDSKEKRNIWEIEAWMRKVEKEDWAVFMQGGDKSESVFRIELKPGEKPQDVIEDHKTKTIEKDPRPFIMAEHWPRRMDNRYLRIIVGKKLITQTDENGEEVKERLNPHGVDSDGDPVLPAIPRLAKLGREAYAYAPTFYAEPVNKSLNKRHSQMLLAVSKMLNAPVYRTDDAKWEGEPDRPGSELIISKNTAIIPGRLTPGTVDLSGLVMQISDDKEYVFDQYDMPDIMRGKIQKGQENMSGRLGIALQDTASMMNNPGFKGLESTMVKAAKVIVSIMLRAWPRYMWERLLTPENQEEWRPEGEQPPENIQKGTDEDLEERQKIRQKWEAAINKLANENINLIDLDIRLTAGSSLPTNRMSKMAEAREMYKEGLYDRKAALKHANDPDAEIISDRMDKKEEQAMLAGMKK